LTEGDVRELRMLRDAGMTFPKLAERFGITTQNAHYIAHRKTWRHV
jgi:hypothetical protein